MFLLGVSTLFCILIFEIFARVYFFTPKGLIPKYGNSVEHMGVSGLVQKSDDCEILYELKPNVDDFYKLARFRTNSKGLRDKEYDLDKKENTIRVAVLGDSLTMPSGVTIDESYHGLLEKWYNEEDKAHTYEFINFGVGGYSLEQSLATLRNKALEYQPDHILLGAFLGNDIPVKNEKKKSCDSYKVKKRANPYVQSWGWQLVGKKTGVTKKPEKSTDYDLNALDSILSEYKSVSVESKIPMTIVTLRIHPEKNSAEFQEFTRYARAYNVPVIDTGKGFSGEEKDIKKFKIYPYDGHPNPEAHRMLAEEIKKSLDLIHGE